MNKDSLTLAKDLQEAGFNAEQSAVLAHLLTTGLVSTDDMHSALRDSEGRLRHDIRIQGKETAAQIVVLEGKINVQGKETAVLVREVVALIKRLDGKIDAQGQYLGGRIDAQDKQIAALVGEMRMQRYGLFGIYAVIVALLAPLAINTLINGGL